MNKKQNLYWAIYKNLEKEMIELSNQIHFDDNQLNVYSIKITELLIRCSIEIESIAKELYEQEGGDMNPADTNGKNRDLYFDTDCMEFLENKWSLSKKNVLVSATTFYFEKNENNILIPLNKANKRGTSGAKWKQAYQALKHNRAKNLSKGNLENLIKTMAALYLLNIYYKNEKIITTYKDYKQLNMTFGSKIFSLPMPTEPNQMWYGNLASGENSVYILKYADATYKNILNMQKKENDARNDYWKEQPELKESLFIKQLSEAIDNERKNPSQRVIYLWELCKYRLNKKVQSDLPFADRKKLLCQTAEWKSSMFQTNNKVSEADLTEDNIQDVINNAGTCAGIMLESSLTRRGTKEHWTTYSFTEAQCEMVIDKSNIKYNL
ncbi:MAG: hypothetical protein LBO69_07970 [Ignavibacteria bacterium]|jgi:hypothetical protein|nr:hypothetical protein [Ignavibacteria bacterium]